MVETVDVDQNSHLLLLPYLEYAVEQGPKISADALFDQSSGIQFKSFNGHHLNDHEATWFRFKVNNNSAKDLELVLNVNDLLFDSIDLSYRRDGQLMTIR